MPCLPRLLAAATLSLAIVGPAWAGDARLPMPGHGTLVFAAPEGWAPSLSTDASRPPTMTLRPADGKSFAVMLTAMWPEKVDSPRPTHAQLHDGMQRRAATMKAQSVDGSVALGDFDAPAVFGSYFTSTDRSPKPGEYTYLVQGIALVDEVVLMFSVLSNDGHEAIEAAALQMLKAVRHDANGPPAPARWPSDVVRAVQRDGGYELSVAPSKLLLRLPQSGLSVKVLGGSNPRYFMLENAALHLVASGWFEPADRFKGARASFEADHLGKDGQLSPLTRDVSYGRVDDWETVSYTMALTPEKTFRHLHAHRVDAGTWIELHLSVTAIGDAGAQDATMREFVRALQVTRQP